MKTIKRISAEGRIRAATALGTTSSGPIREDAPAVRDTLERKDDGFVITEPVSAKADPQRVRDVLGTLEFESRAKDQNLPPIRPPPAVRP